MKREPQGGEVDKHGGIVCRPASYLYFTACVYVGIDSQHGLRTARVQHRRMKQHLYEQCE